MTRGERERSNLEVVKVGNADLDVRFQK